MLHVAITGQEDRAGVTASGHAWTAFEIFTTELNCRQARRLAIQQPLHQSRATWRQQSVGAFDVDLIEGKVAITFVGIRVLWIAEIIHETYHDLVVAAFERDFLADRLPRAFLTTIAGGHVKGAEFLVIHTQGHLGCIWACLSGRHAKLQDIGATGRRGELGGGIGIAVKPANAFPFLGIAFLVPELFRA